MSVTTRFPPSPFFQNCSGFFNASGGMTVQTKFRYVDSFLMQLTGGTTTSAGMNASGNSIILQSYGFITSKSGGVITAQLQNVSSTINISSALGAYVWATGYM